MSLEKDLKKICDDWLNMHRKTGYVPLALIQMRLIDFQPGKLKIGSGAANFRQTFSELVDLNIKFNQFKTRFSSASIETKNLCTISANEIMNKEKMEVTIASVSFLDNLFMKLEKALSDAQNAAQDLQFKKVNNCPEKVCLLAKSLSFLAGFEAPIPKNISAEYGFGLFLCEIFETVKKYYDCDKQDIIYVWHSLNKKWIL